MDKTLLVTISTILGFLGKSLWDIYFVDRRKTDYAEKVKRKTTLEDTFRKYSKPILLSASDLQDRLWHLTQRQAKSQYPILLNEELDEAKSPTWVMSKRHYLIGTIYLIARYFAWIEILKTKIQFIESDNDEYTREFSQKIKAIERILSETNLQKNSTERITSDMQLFQLQQTYIGETLIVNQDGEMTCLRFIDFYDKFDDSYNSAEGFIEIKHLLTRSVSKKKSDFSLVRCCLLANALVDLIDFLDPKAIYISTSERERVSLPNYNIKYKA